MTFMQSTLDQARFAVTLYVGVTCGENASLVNGQCACNTGYEGDPIKGCTAKPTPSPQPTPTPTPTSPTTSTPPESGNSGNGEDQGE